jgi:hypothetical protein
MPSVAKGAVNRRQTILKVKGDYVRWKENRVEAALAEKIEFKETVTNDEIYKITLVATTIL